MQRSLIFTTALLTVALLTIGLKAKLPSSSHSESKETKSTRFEIMSRVQELAGQSLEPACFAAGCYWGVETTLACVPGVVATRVGFTGGQTENPTYKEVCYKETGHAEAVHLTFDPSKVTFEELLDVFFENHDPTTLNRQGPDFGSQYRSAIYYFSEQQKEAALAAKKKFEARLRRPVVTQIVPAVVFYNAEDYHQKYALRLRDHRQLLNSLKLSDKEIVTSPIAAKLNGYVTGQAPAAVLAEVEALPLRDETRTLLSQISFAGPACHYKAPR